MSTIKAILEPDPDGTVHLPLPLELRHGTLQVTATVEPVESNGADRKALRGFGCLKGKLRLSPDFDKPLDDFKEYMA